MVRIQDLVFSYRNFTLQVNSLRFESAKITTIVGPNGAGKTTLLKCLGALLPIRRGTLYVNGRDLASMKGHERARRIGYVPQEHGSIFDYSVLDFVLMGRAPYLSPFSLPSGGDRRIAEEALEFVGLADFSTRSLFHLSSGERRLVLIARTIAQQSDVLLLDEPTSFLDPRHEIELLELTRKLAEERRKTILMTLHNLEMAIKYSDAMIFMKRGNVIASGKPADILDEQLLEKVYDIKMKIVELNGKRLLVR